jgi:formylglycine-generating enzyme required for sulfatase activity
MAGNVWEWCSNTEHDLIANGSNGNQPADAHRAVRGGSFISSPDRAQNTFRFYLNPVYLFMSIGFRVVCNPTVEVSKSPQPK